jgi:glutamate carboxypeptidase
MIEMQALLKQLVETESPSHDKAAVDRVGAIVAGQAGHLGAAVELVHNRTNGDHVIARWEGGKPGILMLCHMDTVFPVGTLARMPFREAQGRIHGPGVLDMKAGIVISLTSMAQLVTSKVSLPYAVTLLCTSDEEIGSPSSRGLIEELARGSSLVLVMEAAMPDGALKTWRKGVGEFEVRVTGRAAHAGGAHAEGRNAIEEMAHQVLAIQKLTDYEAGTTLNVGVVQGGTVTNVVPEEAVAQVDVRISRPEEWGRITAAMNSLQPVLDGTALQVHGVLNRPPMPFDERAQATFARAREIAAPLGLKLEAGGTGGGSDANFVAPLGIPVLDGLGAVGDGYHSEREFILADSLPERASLLAALLREW